MGFAGPYSLGMVGRLNPKWAVFADEHHRTDEADLFDRRRRRSVEVMRFKDGRPSYFDPIATLGADSPRLALPVARYEAEDAIVERYSVIAPVSVGAGNTFIPNTDDKYASTDQGEPPKMMSGQLGEQDIMAIVQAIRNTPEMQWVTSQMQQAIPADQPGPTDGMQAPSPDSQLQLSPDQGPPQAPAYPERNSQCPPPMPAPQPSPTLPQGMAGAGLGQQYAGRYSQLEDEEVTNEQYQALREENEVLAERYSELASTYESLQNANARMVEDYGKMKSAVVQLERRAVDAERLERIKELYSQYPHFVVVEEETERCLYSAGATMSNEEFAEHLASVEKYAQRSSPVSRMVPAGEFAPVSGPKSDLAGKVVERYTSLADRGVFKTYDEVEAKFERKWACNRA